MEILKNKLDKLIELNTEIVRSQAILVALTIYNKSLEMGGPTATEKYRFEATEIAKAMGDHIIEEFGVEYEE